MLTDQEALCQAVRAGDESALLAWADQLEETGDRDAAHLRGVPALLAELEAGRQAWYRIGAQPEEVWLQLFVDGGWRWPSSHDPYNADKDEIVTGELGSSPTLGVLIRRCHEFSAALQWLAGRLALPHAEVAYTKSGEPREGPFGPLRRIDLRTQPLSPPPDATVRGISLYRRPWWKGTETA